MNTGLLLQMALMRLVRFRLQTTLMAIGIIVSVCATTLVAFALANMRDRFAVYFDRIYPTNAIVLQTEAGGEDWNEEGERLDMKDVETILGSTREIADWDPLVFGGQRVVKIGTNAALAIIAGNSERAQQVRGSAVTAGEYFTAGEVRARARVALIGTTVARELFPDGSPVGQLISIDGVQFTIKGVLEKIGLDPHGNDQDGIIQVPYTTLMEQVLKVDFITSVAFVVDDRSRIPAVAQKIDDALRENHPYDVTDEHHFQVITPVDIQRRLDESFATIETFVTFAAAIGYALSGVIIAIVMLMSVKTRTGEIGLRKAVGARARDVQAQILIEAIVLALAASLAGLLLAKLIILTTASALMQHFGLALQKTPLLAIVAVVLAAAATAILSALLPGRRAAKLDPVVSLRQA